MTSRLLLVAALVSLSAGSWAQQAATPASTPAAVQNLQDFTARALLGSGASNPAAAKAAGNVGFDQENAATAAVQAPAPAPSAPPQTGAGQPSSGITYPSDDGSGNGEGSPSDQIGDMIAKALQTPQVTQAIDKVREDQMNKVFNDQRVKGLNKQLTIGASVFAAGLGVGIVGALTANPVLAAAGFGVAAGVGLVAALSWLFK